MNLHTNRNRCTDTENKLIVKNKGRREGGTNKECGINKLHKIDKQQGFTVLHKGITFDIFNLQWNII